MRIKLYLLYVEQFQFSAKKISKQTPNDNPVQPAGLFNFYKNKKIFKKLALNT